MIQEAHNERGIKLFETQFRRWNFEALTGVFKEELESIRIRLKVAFRNGNPGMAISLSGDNAEHWLTRYFIYGNYLSEIY